MFIFYITFAGLFVVVSWISFVVPPDVIPGRMALLITLFLVLGKFQDCKLSEGSISQQKYNIGDTNKTLADIILRIGGQTRHLQTKKIENRGTNKTLADKYRKLGIKTKHLQTNIENWGTNKALADICRKLGNKKSISRHI